jgi:hypothetical protein
MAPSVLELGTQSQPESQSSVTVPGLNLRTELAEAVRRRRPHPELALPLTIQPTA